MGGAPKGSKRCTSFGSSLIDQSVSDELCRALQPLSIDAALEAEEEHDRHRDLEIEAVRQQVQAAQYEADRAFEQYDLADPKNRLVADTLEERLNARLAELHMAKQKFEEVSRTKTRLTSDAKRRLQDLAADFEEVWHDPKADPVLKKSLLRAAIEEVVVTHQVDQRKLEVIIHWKGGVHTKVYAATAANRALSELPNKLQPIPVPSASNKTAGTNTAETRSASRSTAAFVPWA